MEGRRPRVLPHAAKRKTLVSVAERDRQRTRDARPNPSVAAAAADTASRNEAGGPKYGRHAVSFTSRDAAVDLMFPPKPDTGTARGLVPPLHGPPPTDFDPNRFDPVEALRLRWTEGVAPPAKQPPPKMLIPQNLDIFGKVRLPAQRTAPPPAPSGPTDPITGRPAPLSSRQGIAPARSQVAQQAAAAAATGPLDVFGNPKRVPERTTHGRRSNWARHDDVDEAQQQLLSVPPSPGAAGGSDNPARTAAYRPASVANIGGSQSIEQHYARVLSGQRRIEEAQQLAAAAAARHADPTALDTTGRGAAAVAGVSYRRNSTDIFHQAKRDDHANAHRRRPPDFGGDGVLIADSSSLGHPQRRPPAAAAAVIPYAVRHVASVPVVSDEEVAAARRNAAWRLGPNTTVGATGPEATPAGTARGAAGETKAEAERRLSRQSEQQRKQQQLLAPQPDAVLRTSPAVRQLLRQSRGWGLRPLRVALRNRDPDGDGLISTTDVRRALATLQIEVVSADDAELWRRVGATPSMPHGRVAIPLLLEALRDGPLAPAREAAVRGAYADLTAFARNLRRGSAKPGDDLRDVVPTVADACLAFQPAAFHTYNAHDTASARELQSAFSRLWGPDMKAQSPLRESHFQGFFHDVSPSVTADATFVNMMKRLFRPISGP